MRELLTPSFQGIAEDIRKTIGDKISWWKEHFPEEIEWVGSLVRK